MTKVEKYFQLAKQAALSKDLRQYKLGAVGIRTDGTIVTSRNLPTRAPNPRAHAEYRLIQKMDWGSIMYVVRVLADGSLTMSRPCKYCVSSMRLRGIKKCYYSITNDEYGVLIND